MFSSPAAPLLCFAACFFAGVRGHGWMTSPVSKNELAFHHYQPGMGEETDFHYEPQTSNHGNGIGNMGEGKGFSCGANNESYVEGLGLWKQWYDAAGVAVPRIKPGQDLPVNVTLTIDHGGQAWVMLACADHITEGANWTVLERSKNDRTAHFMPSSPGAFAWAQLEYEAKYGNKMAASWVVPEDFSCPLGHGVARWLWKTGNSCNDYRNIARKTETFKAEEFAAVVHAYKPGIFVEPACTSPPETFISCMDFVIGDPTPPSPPTPPGPPSPPSPPTPPSPTPGPCTKVWQQCGAGHGSCCDGCTCEGTKWYSECKPPKGEHTCGKAAVTVAAEAEVTRQRL